MPKSALNIALYVRFSSEDKLKSGESSIESQKLILKQFVNNMDENIDSCKCYVDNDESGANYNRPAFIELQKDIENKLINCVITKDSSRLGRNHYETSLLVENYFPNHNVRFISLTPKYDSKNLSKNQALNMSIMTIVDEKYLSDCSKKSKKSYEIRRQNNFFTAPYAPYGYKKEENNPHKLVVDNQVVDIINFIFDDYLSKKSFTKVAQDLSLKQIPSPSEYKRESIKDYYTNKLTTKKNIWSTDTVSNILKNEVYIGNLVQNKRSKVSYKSKKTIKNKKQDWVISKNTHEPIISQDKFDLVQEIIKNNKKPFNVRKRKQKDNYFSGLIYCGNCNSRFYYIEDKNRKYTFYKCHLKSLSTKLCNADIIKTKDLENLVITLINKHYLSLCVIKKMLEKSKKDIKKNTVRKDYTKTESYLINLKDTLYFKYQEDLISKDMYLEKVNSINAQIKEIKTEKEKEANTTNLISKLEQEIQKYKGIKKLTREIAKTLIKKIVVYSQNQIEITFNFNDFFTNSETI